MKYCGSHLRYPLALLNSETSAEEVFHDTKQIGLAQRRLASLILFSKPHSACNFLLLPRANFQPKVGLDVSVASAILATTSPQARAAPNNACSLTQKYLAMKILFLSCNSAT